MNPTGPRKKTARDAAPAGGGSGPEDPVAVPAPAAGGQTRPQVSGNSSPRLPHERDESADSQAGGSHADMKQAHADVTRGLVDTDRGPVMDELYEHRVRPPGQATPDRAAPVPLADDPEARAARRGGRPRR